MPTRAPLATVAAVFALAAVPAAAIGQDTGWLGDERCRLATASLPAAYGRCGTLAVPLDPTAPDGPKIELFVALAERCNDRIYQAFADAAAEAKAAGDDNVLQAMGHAYIGLLADRTLLLNQLHAHAASDNPEIRTQMRRGFARLVDLVERESGADPVDVRRFFAHGMLLNVLAAMSAEEVDEHWAHVLLGPDES